MRSILLALAPLALGALCALPGVAATNDDPRPLAVPPVVDAEARAPLIQLAILLDTSNSMDGLINQARSQLWTIVNGLGRTARAGKAPIVQVALYEYGQSTIAADEQYLRQVLPFTTDLDRVSEKLFSLVTRGGEEYCGAAIRAATRGLQWSTQTADLREIIIAGNEPFTQGSIDYRASCIEAAAHGILINTIFCGPVAEGIASNWQDGARLANGSFFAIDQQRTVVVPSTPQDAELARLGIEINVTYVPYGRVGRDGAANQMAQDTNATNSSIASSASRAFTKAGGNYANGHWDLVDALECKAVDLGQLPAADLPEALRAMNADQQRAYLAAKKVERLRLQARILELGAERERFLTKIQKSGDPTLDTAILNAIRAQAATLGFVVQ